MTKTAPILLVEDNDDYAFIVRRTWSKLTKKTPLLRFSNGEEALSYFQGIDELERSRAASLVLLDLQMPRMDGFSVLKFLREQEGTRSTPVFLFTSSDFLTDAAKAQACGATGFCTKPSHIEELGELLLSLKQQYRLE